MNGQRIGIKLADGSFYPVLTHGQRGRKKLTLTTVRDNQETVQIDLFRGEGGRAEETEYIGTLMVEHIEPAPMNEPEVEVVLGVDDAGNLEATASDAMTGESQSLSITLESLSGRPAAPQFELEREGAQKEDFEEPLLTGESYPVSSADRRKEHLQKKRRSPLLLIGFILLSLILIAAIAFLVFRAIGGTPIPPLFGGGAQTAEAGTADGTGEGTGSPAPEQPARKPPESPPAGETRAAAAQEEPEAEGPAGGLWYNIKWGDTLWDISATYYRNPWLYPKIARANRIANPDLIIAGTKLFIPEN